MRGRPRRPRSPASGAARRADRADPGPPGWTSDLSVNSTSFPVGAAAELAAYRIVQEALTNTRRHAPGAAVDVELPRTADCLHLRVRDNGPGPPSAAPARGHGLTGMRERAAAVGGELRTGPAAGGGFLVDAVLPARLEEHDR